MTGIRTGRPKISKMDYSLTRATPAWQKVTDDWFLHCNQGNYFLLNQYLNMDEVSLDIPQFQVAEVPTASFWNFLNVYENPQLIRKNVACARSGNISNNAPPPSKRRALGEVYPSNKCVHQENGQKKVPKAQETLGGVSKNGILSAAQALRLCGRNGVFSRRSARKLYSQCNA